MQTLLAALVALDTLAMLRNDPIVGSEVSPRSPCLSHFVASVESTIDAYTDGAPATLRSPRTMSEAFYMGAVSK